MRDRNFYQTVILPKLVELQALCNDAEMPYLFIVQIGDETFDYSASYPPDGVSKIIFKVSKNSVETLIIPDKGKAFVAQHEEHNMGDDLANKQAEQDFLDHFSTQTGHEDDG